VLGNLELSLSVQNLFNAKPQTIRTTLLSDAPFDSTNSSPVGRFVALRIAKQW
jgi:outer membrane receptor protein involved in Fe transport